MTAAEHKTRIGSISDEVAELHPLLQELLPRLPNVSDTEYTHGANEMGADFVLQTKHRALGDTTYVGVIAKAGPIRQDHSDIDRQIEECAIPRKFRNGKREVRLGEVWIVTSGNVTNNAQSAIHAKYCSKSVHFIDGSRLADLVERYLPFYWSRLPLPLAKYLAELISRIDEAESQSVLTPANQEPDLAEVVVDGYKSKATQKAIALDEILDDERQITVLEGDMGSGKSKLLRLIAKRAADPAEYERGLLIPVLLSARDVRADYEFRCQR